ncbi:SDR family oxidoreductase [Bosea sp. (in: a-proteobacteria)]|jgi:nucleoside-diphosphate-sugar epimerase|uniref:SDR family oxidoreductase n=1 Tax=Bosea sp. (in: a-proteobacteria) TaxID=1871050 RepID=UPI003F70DF85
MNRTILLTGACGTLGSQLLKRLLGQGHSVVCLVRGRDQAHVQARVAAIIGARVDVAVWRGDLREPLCGLSTDVISTWRGRIDTILHCAASIEFRDSRAAQATNVEGVRNILVLAEALGVSEFRHVSTAYVAGDSERFAEEDLDAGQSWRNAYEHSKYLGETLVRAWAAQAAGRSFTVHRPSILIGCQDGSIPAFDAYYTYLKPFALAAASMRRRGRDRLPDGIRISGFDTVALPVAVQIRDEATLNLVPLDWAAQTVVRLLGKPSRNATFHVVHPEPPRVRDMLETSLRLLRIEGVRIVQSTVEKERLAAAMPPVLSRLHHNIEKVLLSYLPYTTGEARFGDDGLRRELADEYVAAPEIDEAYLARLLAYAEAKDWGIGAAAHAPAPMPVRIPA